MDDLSSPQEQDTGIAGHQQNAEDPWPPTHAGSSSGASLGANGSMSLGSMNENPDQTTATLPLPITRVLSAKQGELPSQEPEANTIPTSNIASLGQESVHTTENTSLSPSEAPIELPTQTCSDSTNTLTGTHAMGPSGTLGHTTVRSDKDPTKKDSTRPKSKNRKALPPQKARSTIAPAPYTALDQSPSPASIDEWPQLPGQAAHDLDGPSPDPTAMPLESTR